MSSINGLGSIKTAVADLDATPIATQSVAVQTLMAADAPRMYVAPAVTQAHDAVQAGAELVRGGASKVCNGKCVGCSCTPDEAAPGRTEARSDAPARSEAAQHGDVKADATARQQLADLGAQLVNAGAKSVCNGKCAGCSCVPDDAAPGRAASGDTSAQVPAQVRTAEVHGETMGVRELTTALETMEGNLEAMLRGDAPVDAKVLEQGLAALTTGVVVTESARVAEVREVLGEVKAAIVEERGQAAESRGAESRAAIADERAPMAESRAPKADERLPMADTRAPIADDRSPMVDSRAPIADERLPTADSRAPIADERLPMADTRAPIAENRTPIADDRSPIADSRAQSGERASPETRSEHPHLEHPHLEHPRTGAESPKLGTASAKENMTPATTTRASAAATDSRAPTAPKSSPAPSTGPTGSSSGSSAASKSSSPAPSIATKGSAPASATAASTARMTPMSVMLRGFATPPAQALPGAAARASTAPQSRTATIAQSHSAQATPSRTAPAQLKTALPVHGRAPTPQARTTGTTVQSRLALRAFDARHTQTQRGASQNMSQWLQLANARRGGSRQDALAWLLERTAQTRKRLEDDARLEDETTDSAEAEGGDEHQDERDEQAGTPDAKPLKTGQKPRMQSGGPAAC